MTEVKEMQLIDQKELRDQAIEKVDVLNKVKELFLIPNMNVLTTNQVADYYEVPVETIQTCYKVNKNEIDTDGVSLKPYKDFSIVGFKQLNISKGKASFQIDKNTILTIPTRGIKVFSQRAILRIGMLLRDSKVAKEVRTQLLNTFEHSSIEQRTVDINEEQSIMLEIGRATMYGDVLDISKAYNTALSFKNRHINKLEQYNKDLEDNNITLKDNNKALAGEILSWTDRSHLNKAVRTLASKVSKPFGYIYKELYDELLYKHHIGLSQRGDPPYLQHIKEPEWKLVMQSFSAICENNGYNSSKIVIKTK